MMTRKAAKRKSGDWLQLRLQYAPKGAPLDGAGGGAAMQVRPHNATPG